MTCVFRLCCQKEPTENFSICLGAVLLLKAVWRRTADSLPSEEEKTKPKNLSAISIMNDLPSPPLPYKSVTPIPPTTVFEPSLSPPTQSAPNCWLEPTGDVLRQRCCAVSPWDWERLIQMNCGWVVGLSPAGVGVGKLTTQTLIVAAAP